MIITGGENVSPGEIESVLSLHPAIAEVAVAGLPDERWGQRVVAFVKRAVRSRRRSSTGGAARSGLANFKRPRDYVFVARCRNRRSARLLRRKLVAGEYRDRGASKGTQRMSKSTPSRPTIRVCRRSTASASRSTPARAARRYHPRPAAAQHHRHARSATSFAPLFEALDGPTACA